MDGLEFRKRGREMVDYIVDYLDNIDARRVTPSIEPGYLQELVPENPPEKPESFDAIMDDVEKKIMIGMTHWQHPRFHAYFPAGNSFPSILGSMLGDAIGCVGFSWAAAPACTELETIMLDWMGKMIGLPDDFLSNKKGSIGGGVIQSCASECILDCLLAARAQMIQRLKVKYGDEVEETSLLSKLMAYCSKEAHSCVEKAAMIGFVKLRILEPDESCSLRGETLRQAMEEDMENGLYPFFVSTTLGTTGCCAFDNLKEIGPICDEYGAWLHVDASYGGNCFICPEYQYLMKGVEYASSFNMNPNKWMLVNFDCSLMWVRDRFKLTQALVVDPLYLQHSYSESAIDYRHWGIPLRRRFRSLKLWFVIRTYGVSGLQEYIREHCRLAKLFEQYVKSDRRFEVCNNVRVGLVCFRLCHSDEVNQKLLSAINASGKLHMVPASVNDKYVIRFCVCAPNATDEDIEYAWRTIAKMATDVLEKMEIMGDDMVRIKTEEGEEGDNFERENSAQKVEDKPKHNIKYKRSFFVRMVSDPKIYNPKIVKIKDMEADGIDEENNQPGRKKKTGKRTWVSWPLAFILRSGSNTRRSQDVATMAEKEVSMRFRNWNTRLTISPHGPSSASSEGSSPTKAKRAEDVDDDLLATGEAMDRLTVNNNIQAHPTTACKAESIEKPE
ncbi:aromatic-L-amino-acid decarboxylase-like isoform X2 [Tigriopus californicus]|nr:aromatic-L-amino-acid decarboxylase-like isoform X2 [Tigriopus californicus]XP_059085405.1 aromatic-L-amino-acid decarboxylase-like isoform X2 [Tigriopus californicus]XP_059085406.1 aromatic-L-amino-acid decarboxylase-like isoform X2 [Tigriopus californicus]